MNLAGRFIVFEGPDGTGKTTLARLYADEARAAGERVTAVSFPGNEVGTLGHHVYQLHHDLQRFGIREVTSASLQALHIAAHLDAIERSILPALERGDTLVLDRYWWSTWVYGTEAGVNAATLDAMIASECAHWGAVLPDVMVLVTRQDSLRPQDSGPAWRRRSALYESLAEREAASYPVRVVSNDGTEERAFENVMKAVSNAMRTPQSRIKVGPDNQNMSS